MMLLSKKLRGVEGDGLNYWCEGCNHMHGINYGSGRWAWNGDAEKPTFAPSVLVRYPANPYADDAHAEWRKERICHTFITDGKVQYLNDCTHHLAGQTVDLPNLPDWMQD